MTANKTQEEEKIYLVDEEMLRLLTQHFIDSSSKFLQSIKKNNPKVEALLSTQALINALCEFQKDMQIMAKRRNDKDLSIGKYAGSLAFRLGRWGIVHFYDETDQKDYSYISYLIAISISLRYFLNIQPEKIEQSILDELSYTFTRRHMNQETLGICFDLFDKYIPKNP